MFLKESSYHLLLYYGSKNYPYLEKIKIESLAWNGWQFSFRKHLVGNL